MMDEHDVRERLRAVEVPPTGLRVETLVEGSRRRALRRQSMQAAGGVALVTGLLVGVPSLLLRPGGDPPDQVSAIPTAEVSPSASGGPRQVTADPRLPTVSCAATRLPVPAGTTAVQPAGVDPSGRYVVGNDARSSELSTPEGKVAGVGESRVILWTDGQPRALPTVRDWVSASAVNADGVVAAVAGPRDRWADTVVRYTGGVPETLQPPAGKWQYTGATINADGDILVNADRQSSDGRQDAVLLWKAGSKLAHKLPLPAYAEGKGITDDGTIVGLVVAADGRKLTSYTWDQRGVGQALKVPAGQQASVSSARDGWATGNLWPSGEVGRWDLRTGAVTRLPVGSPANGINAKGWIASNGTVLRDDANVELERVDEMRGDPLAISDSGLVVGLPFDGRSGVITWRCDR